MSAFSIEVTDIEKKTNPGLRRNLVWQPNWPMSGDAASIQAKDTPYQELPRHHQAIHVHKADAVAAIGILSGNAFAQFSQAIDVPRPNKKTTAWVKQPGEIVLRLPEDLERFQPAIDEAVQVELLNIPHKKLWPYFRMRAAIEAHVVEKNTQQRLGNKPHQDVAREKKTIENCDPPLPDLSTTILTMTDDAPTIFLRDLAVETGEDGKREKQYIEPVSFSPGALVLYSGESWHLPGKTGGEDRFRNFMALQVDIDRKLLAQDMADDAELRDLVKRWLRASALHQILVPAGIQAAMPAARHDPDNIYQYPQPGV